jgi:hypothetical protein
MGKMLTIPLHNLKLEPPIRLDLGDSTIIPWKDASGDLLGAILRTTGEECPFLLQMPPREGEQPRRTLDRALTVFKLFKDSIVLSRCVFQGTDLIDDLPHYIHWQDPDRGVPLFHLDEHEKTMFASFWKEFIETNPGNFAVHRFHLADYRAYSADRFVDYVESLEYLLVPDSGEGEIGYKFRSRGVLILGADKKPVERAELYSQLRDAYDMRSAIVHGNENKQKDLRKDKTWEEILGPVRCHDRQAIRFFFRAGCLGDADRRREMLNDRLLFSAQIS